ncbi:FtsL-like putative cell division protein [Mucilaginibacter defluvii]|uniref:Cell division protein FtsL n=1 Tax=Mucilaginibacter defluvii TaxID=1196019 RepID=A0ABP9FZ97_9SPHI
MTNRLRSEIEEEVAEKELIVEEKPAREIPDNLFTQFLNKGFVTTEEATRALPFILYVAFLCMLYIANRHLAERNLRDIDKISKEVKELTWDYKSAKAELAYKSTLTEVAKRTDTIGIKQSLEPPQKITVKEDQNGN